MLSDVHAVAAVLRRGRRILAARRLPGGSAGLKWEFPGGKVERGETATSALLREIHEELGLDAVVTSELGTFVTDLPDFRIHLKCFWCEAPDGLPQLRVHSEVRWCTPGELRSLDWAQADIPVVEAILRLHAKATDDHA